MKYGMPDKRKTKRDKKAKSKYGRYKKGGRHRASKLDVRKKEKDK